MRFAVSRFVTAAFWRRPAGHSLVFAWLLWQAAAPMVPNTPHEGAAAVQSFRTEGECQKAATIKRSTRNAVILRGAPAYDMFTRSPQRADPEARARSELRGKSPASRRGSTPAGATLGDRQRAPARAAAAAPGADRTPHQARPRTVAFLEPD
jgi:hypothetical protein